jgi:hypothetical protein
MYQIIGSYYASGPNQAFEVIGVPRPTMVEAIGEYRRLFLKEYKSVTRYVSAGELLTISYEVIELPITSLTESETVVHALADYYLYRGIREDTLRFEDAALPHYYCGPYTTRKPTKEEVRAAWNLARSKL